MLTRQVDSKERIFRPIPISYLIQTANQFDCDIYVTSDKTTANIKRYDEVKKSMSAVESQRKQMLSYAELQKQKTGEQKQKKALSAAEGSMERVLNKTEEAMYRSFPVDRSGKNYINLSREGLIHQYMDEARQEFGARTSENVRVMRNRSRKGRYDSRL